MMLGKTLNRNTTRWWLAIGFLLILATVFVSLGNWQLNRAQERRVIAQTITSGQDASILTLSTQSTLEGLLPWQRATVTGSWRPELSFLLDNRNLDGRPGLWLATPLELEPGRLLLVLRGWLARPIGQYNALPAITAPNGPISLEGEVATHVPRLYSLGEEAPIQWMDNQALTIREGETTLALKDLPRRQNVSIAELSDDLDQAFMPFVLLQTSAVADDVFVRQWPKPSIDADKNVGYAIQWFGFAGIALVAIGVLLWRMPRRAKIVTVLKDKTRGN
jgi:surfeit locus 1 family protein|uniref:SURF1 family protein n=1 Tax=Orrella sp. TaxID=1921583 RepID=UPI0040473249